jgi:hypothetical protein
MTDQNETTAIETTGEPVEVKTEPVEVKTTPSNVAPDPHADTEPPNPAEAEVMTEEQLLMRTAAELAQYLLAGALKRPAKDQLAGLRAVIAELALPRRVLSATALTATPSDWRDAEHRDFLDGLTNEELAQHLALCLAHVCFGYARGRK